MSDSKRTVGHLDPQHFAAEVLRLGGRAHPAPPATLEELFDGLHDADDFDASTAVSILAARAATTRETQTLSSDPLTNTVTIHPGDVVANADFTFNSHVLVLGDLRVSGTITASPAHAILMVAGDVDCRAMELIRCYLFVTGSLRARECFFGCAYGFSKVAGDIETRLFLHDDSWANMRVDASDDITTANVIAETVVCTDDDDADERVRAVVRADALGDAFEPTDLLATIAGGTDVFLTEAT